MRKLIEPASFNKEDFLKGKLRIYILAKKTMLPNKNAWRKRPLALGSSEHFFIGIDQPETGWPIPMRSLKKLLGVWL